MAGAKKSAAKTKKAATTKKVGATSSGRSTKKKKGAKAAAPKATAAKRSIVPAPAAAKRPAARAIDDEAPTVEIASARIIRASVPPPRSVPPPAPEAAGTSGRPSEQVPAPAPAERPLTPEEHEAMAKVAETARVVLGVEGGPDAIVDAIARFLDDVRLGRREEPKSQDVRLGLGVLWGEQVRALAGWAWVHLSYPDGFASYALVPEDRAFAAFPLNRVPEALGGEGTNTSAHVFESIREGALPTRRPRTYLVIG